MSFLNLPQSHRILTCVRAQESISSPELENCAIPRRICCLGCCSWVFQHISTSRGLGMLQRTLHWQWGCLQRTQPQLRTLKPSVQPWTKRFEPEEQPGCTSAILEANLSHLRLLNSTEAPAGSAIHQVLPLLSSRLCLTSLPYNADRDFWVIVAPCRDRPLPQPWDQTNQPLRNREESALIPLPFPIIRMFKYM